MPFAHDLIVATRPAVFVELGTHLGESYFGFCQSLAENDVSCLAYAVDTWTGEAHAGFYDETVYEEVAAYNEANYPCFSYLVRGLFDDALPNFADESVELLHIDGLHTFEAVSHDFYAWLPKVKPGGIILLHDIVVKHRGFGVWKLWDELKSRGKTFEFHHSWGLGVFQKPGTNQPESELLKTMFDFDDRTKEQIRKYYSLSAIDLAWKHVSDPLVEEKHRLQVYLPSSEGYSETDSHSTNFKPNQWERLQIEIPQGLTIGQLRLDLADCPSIVEVRGISLLSAVDQKPLWSTTDQTECCLTPGGTLISVNSSKQNEAFQFFSYGNDPQLFLPSLDPKRFDQPLIVEIWIRLQTKLDPLLPLLEKKNEKASIEPQVDTVGILKSEHAEIVEGLISQKAEAVKNLELQHAETVKNLELQHAEAFTTLQVQFEKEKAAVSHEFAAVNTRLATADIEQQKLIQEVNRKQTKIYLLEGVQHELPQAEKRIAEMEDEYKNLKNSFDNLQAANRTLLQQHHEIETTFNNVLGSHSWRLTAPLRKVMELLQGR